MFQKSINEPFSICRTAFGTACITEARANNLVSTDGWVVNANGVKLSGMKSTEGTFVFKSPM